MLKPKTKRERVVDDLVTDALVMYRHLLSPATLDALQTSLAPFILRHPERRSVIAQLMTHPERVVSAAITRQGEGGR